MKLLKPTLIALLISIIYAQPVQIDMHGGKHMKIPSKNKQITSMKEFLKMDTNTTDHNKTIGKK